MSCFASRRRRAVPAPMSLSLALALTLLLLVPAVRAEETVVRLDPEVRAGDLRRHLAWLASEELEGREAGTPGAHLAGEYVARQMARAGLEPAGTEGYFQPFGLRRAVLGEGNRLAFVGEEASFELPVEEAFNPFSVSPTKEARGALLFAGYGIRAPDRRWTDAAGAEHRGWDDYAGVDVSGRIVLVLRKDPGWNAVRHAAFLAKLSLAAEQGAAGLLVVNDSTSLAGGRDVIGHWSAPIGAPAGSGRIPFAFVRRDAAERLLAAAGLDASLAELEAAIRAGGPASRVLPRGEVILATALATEERARARNVAGLLPGTDPALADEVVVVGAHYDHIGRGRFGSLGGAGASDQVHPGADDNASGTGVLLELLDHFAAAPPRRSLLFLAFSGEEMGLLGSRHWTEHPTVPLERLVAMANLDMVGRAGDRELFVGGVGTGEGLREIVERANEAHRFHLTLGAGGASPTDSASFFRKKIPVLFFFSGIHEQYHRPTDTVDRIEFEALEGVGRLVADVVRTIADADRRLLFTEPPAPPRPPQLGVRPSPEADPRGVRVDAVVPGGPAAEAGLRPGDVVVALAGQVVRTLEDLRGVLVQLRPGRPVPVEVLRDGETMRLEIVPAGRGRR